ncbi:unnamed protein product [Clonostachys rhizophaga]|uniref:Uncharacterized protein n=1 Tax=Clonostachys rhizophaga TaxID=160324 RepID=A0A9N9VDR9_9HYPO|nr:unnamed protein product [Clonostachys rhizophaga]
MELLSSPSSAPDCLLISDSSFEPTSASASSKGAVVMESPYSSDPPDHEKWPCPESLPDLASVHEELGRLETLEQVVNQHIRDAEGQEGAHPSSGEASVGEEEPSLTQQYAWRDIAQRLKQQQAALESRAAHLSRRPISGACLANLSTEILAMIVKCFEYTPNYEDTGRQGVIAEFPEENRRAIQALRLTSRHLNLMATPLLMPVVTLSVDNASLTLARSLIYHPHMGAGVQAIRVGLENRPADLLDMYAFLGIKEAELVDCEEDLRTELSEVTMLLAQAYSDKDDETASKLEIAGNNMYEANSRAEMVCLAVAMLKDDQFETWKARLEGQPDPVQLDVDPANEDLLSRYKRLATLAHKEYCRIQREQNIYIQTRIFVETVALLARQGRQPLSLEFFENRRYKPGKDSSTTHTPYRNDKALFEFLLDAPVWGALFYPVRINVLHDLPVALRNTGRFLKGFQISCPPLLHQIPSIYSDNQPNNTWDEFNAASQELRFLNLEGRELKGVTVGDPAIAASGRRGICKYFSGLLSGHCFEQVSFDGCAYKDRHPRDIGTLFPMGQAFASIEWPHIKTVRILHVSMTQAEVEGFFRGLGTILEEIVMHDVQMRGGRWKPALGILREKVARRRQGAPGFHDAHLLGRDIHLLVESGDELVVRNFERSNRYTVMKLIERYVNDDGISENPLGNYGHLA